jgi:hypothetical protein
MQTSTTKPMVSATVSLAVLILMGLIYTLFFMPKSAPEAQIDRSKLTSNCADVSEPSDREKCWESIREALKKQP